MDMDIQKEGVSALDYLQSLDASLSDSWPIRLNVWRCVVFMTIFFLPNKAGEFCRTFSFIKISQSAIY